LNPAHNGILFDPYSICNTPLPKETVIETTGALHMAHRNGALPKKMNRITSASRGEPDFEPENGEDSKKKT